MHSSLVRIQNIFGFFTSVAGVMAALVAVSVFLIPQAPQGDVTVRKLEVVKGRPHYYSTKRTEYASIRFDIEADLTSLFNWNTKQVFVWVEAVYPDPAGPAGGELSRAVIWDSIVQSTSATDPPDIWDILAVWRTGPPTSQLKSKKAKKPKSPRASTQTGPPGKLSIRNTQPKYKISDPSGKLQGAQNVTLRLGYNVQPWVGALLWTQKQDLGRWAALAERDAPAFALPAIKGAAKDKETVVGKGEVPRP